MTLLLHWQLQNKDLSLEGTESILALNMFSQSCETLFSPIHITKAGSQEHCSYMSLQENQMLLEIS